MTALPLKINYSTEKLVLFLAGSVLFVVFFVWVFIGASTGTKPEFPAVFLDWAFILFLGLIVAGALAQLVFLAGRTALTLTKSGFTCPIFSPDEVPWRFVTHISTRSIRIRFLEFRFLEAGLDQTFARNVRRNRYVRFANPRLRSFSIGTLSLGVPHDQLFAVMHDCWRAAQVTEHPIGPGGSQSSAGE